MEMPSAKTYGRLTANSSAALRHYSGIGYQRIGSIGPADQSNLIFLAASPIDCSWASVACRRFHPQLVSG